jgi:hypothetical protein
MKNIQEFLEKFKKLTPPEKTARTAFKNALQNVLQLTLEDRFVQVEGKRIRLVCSPGMRLKILQNKALVLVDIQKKSPLISVEDIV